MGNHMKNSLVLICLLISPILFGQEKDERRLDEFREVKVSEGIELYIKKGSGFSIEIEAWDIDVEKVLTEIRRDELHVHMRTNTNRRKKVKAYLTYQGDLEGITANTGAEAILEDEIKNNELELTANTSGQIEVKVDVNYLDLGATTSGRIDVSGKTGDIEASASTGGTIYAYDVEAKEGSVRSNTGAEIRVNVSDYLQARANTGGSIRYKGNPKVSSSTNTGGSIRKAN